MKIGAYSIWALRHTYALNPIGSVGDHTNALQACTGYNLRKRLIQIKRDIFVPIFRGLYSWSKPRYFAAA